MRGLTGLVETVLAALHVHLQPWMAPLAILLLALAAWPLMRLNVKTDDARRLLKRASRERGDARERLEQEALALAGARPDGLVVVADIALQQGRHALARQAIERLEATGKNLTALRRLQRELDGPQPATALEAALIVERLREAGLHAQADARLEKFRARWPGDEELR